MNIVLGASGQVGSAIAHHLLDARQPVKAVVRDAKKAADLKAKGASVAIADAFDLASLKKAFKDGTTVFLITPETGESNDVLGDTATILANYKEAIASSPIKKIVGLSSIGAQVGAGSGNLEMSYMLEHAFTDLDVQQIFVRPSYYYSNWLPYLPSVKKTGVLPTFYPDDVKLPMTSPLDVAEFVAQVMQDAIEGSPIYEVEGPQWLNSQDVANAFGEFLGREVKAEQMPKAEWPKALEKMGFTPDAVKNFIEMTEIVNLHQGSAEREGKIQAQTQTTLQEYLAEQAKN